MENNLIKQLIPEMTKNLSHKVSWQARLVNPISNLYNDNYASIHGKIDRYRQFLGRLDNSTLSDHSPLYLLARIWLLNIVLNALGNRMEMTGSIEGKPLLIDHKKIKINE